MVRLRDNTVVSSGVLKRHRIAGRGGDRLEGVQSSQQVASQLAIGLREGAVRCHEAGDQRGDQLRRFGCALIGLARQHLTVGDEIAVYSCRQLDGEFDRLVVVNGAGLQLRRDRASALVGFENEVVGHHHSH